ncbi:AraC family transcriptional regulator [Rhodobium gokarnense]|uniref:AraC-like DNA-binding protein n=1 Tax=Rhodobium gokarnense TaxID=364296 RepID=A0ABT3H5R8_9HYPH|nr:AraC family transcriptional regulator [Rhodobium gokarnense]MCW2305739.1 AraC-like DNA-binding protein [Rhodobium gokarnense]
MCGTEDIGTIRPLAASEGLQVFEASALRYAFAPHRHDAYVVGITTHGVQSFRYRREARASLPGQAFVIHPDEQHDGHPGTEAAYGYLTAYLAPDLIAEALGGRPLPFVGDVVNGDAELLAALRELFSTADPAGDDLGAAASVTRLADVFARMAGGMVRDGAADWPAMRRIRDHLLAGLQEGVSMAELEAEHGLDRFAISRGFRCHFGVSPHRFLVLRRLERAQADIRAGASLADAALAAGFADQAHMTRQFRQAFGVTPGVWRRLVG